MTDHTHPAAPDHDGDARLSIGAVSQATGIPAETLRTWERRYGFPQPERAEKGHRKYSLATVERLKLTSEALARGHRPANVVGASIEALRRLLDLHLAADEATPALEEISEDAPLTPVTPLHREPARDASEDVLRGWMEATLRLDAATLQESFERAWFRLGALEFFTQLAGPFLHEIGHAWCDGRIAVLHEQFVSAQLGQFLMAHWRPLSERACGERAVCATLPGEHHALGLHMLATVLAMTGCQVVYLGCDVPLELIASAAEEAESKLVLLSLSAAASPARARQQLARLRALLPEDVRLIIGGGGAPEDAEGVERFDDLRQLQSWLARHYLKGATG